MSAIGAVLYREGKIRFTNFTFILWDLFYPLGYLLLFGLAVDEALAPALPLEGVTYNDFFLSGVLGMASFVIASNASWSFFLDRDNGIFYEMLTYPLSRAEYLLGKVLINVLLALAQATITIGLGWLLIDVRIPLQQLPLLALGIAVGTAGWFFFYAILALRIRRNDLFNSVTSVFFFFFPFLSSMFYPVEPLPGWFRIVALSNPTTWQVDVLRHLTIGWGAPRVVLLEALAFVAFATVSFAVAVRSLREQE
jgi:ABC-2 type transport system permease protein